MKKYIYLLLVAIVVEFTGLLGAEEGLVIPEQHKIAFASPQEMKEFFSTRDSNPGDSNPQGRRCLVSAHRGGARKDCPENCIRTFEETLMQMPALFEIDPRMTKDGNIVLMHDKTLDRTTNGRGQVSDYTYEELKRFRLKDLEGNVTDVTIPTLRETITWAKGKTVLVIDRKDVPLETTEQIIREMEAENHCVVIVYNFEEAKKYHDANKDIMMEVFLTKIGDIERFEKTGIPWENVIPFVGLEEPARELYQILGQKKRLCMIGCTRAIDRNVRETGDATIYEKLLLGGASILETDLPLRAKEFLPFTGALVK